MDKNLELYRTFWMVARLGSFSAAARELYVSQPAVSQAVRQLEECLEVRLFVRRARGVALTEEGRQLFHYVEPAMGLLEAGRDRVLQMKQLLGGELRIGAGDTISKHFLLPYLQRFHEAYPGIHLHVTNRTSAETLDLLYSGAVELALVNAPVEGENLEVWECLQLHDVFVAGPAFEELRGRPVSRGELARQPLVMLERLSNTRRQIDQCFLQSGVELSPEIELGAHDLLLDFARSGLGVASVIREFAREPLENGELFEVDLREPLPVRAVALCRRSDLEPGPAAQKFSKMLKGEENGG
ncbi:MAG: LysR family transcriptional regulator [Oscillospiraceae bacterium]|nr:LysR family transcriptional regulator [Oscillospiraceae bacterium]